MRILLIENDPATAERIANMLKSEESISYATDQGEEGIDLAKMYDYDLIALDMMNLADMSGFEVLRILRGSGVKTPVVAISSSETIADKVRALELGADDYITRPFHGDELLARIGAVVRRSRGIASAKFTLGDFTIDFTTRSVTVGDQRVPLTPKEYQMLELMCLRNTMIISKEMFLNHLYGGLDEPDLKIIDVFICKLRLKLRNAMGGRNIIETAWGRGYMLKVDAEPPVNKGSRWHKIPKVASPSIAPVS